MHFQESDIQFSELIAQCRIHLAENEFDEIFDLLAQYEIPKQGNVVLAKALWLRLKIDKMQGLSSHDEILTKTQEIVETLDAAFSVLQDIYVNSSKGFIESSSSFELIPRGKRKHKDVVIKRKKSLLSFAQQKVISLDDFIGFIEENGIARLEASGELKSLNGLVLTWEGKSGSVVPLNPHHPNSDYYLIFWPINDKMFQLDPIVAFFDFHNKPFLEKISRGDKIVLRGRLEINSTVPKIALRKTSIIKHKKGKGIF